MLIKLSHIDGCYHTGVHTLCMHVPYAIDIEIPINIHPCHAYKDTCPNYVHLYLYAYVSCIHVLHTKKYMSFIYIDIHALPMNIDTYLDTHI